MTPLQMAYLLYAVRASEALTESVIVELGAYRGVTTRLLAQATSRTVVAVDRYLPRWAEAESRVACFRRTYERPVECDPTTGGLRNSGFELVFRVSRPTIH